MDYGEEDDPKELMVITPQSPLIDSVANRAITILERAETNLGKVRLEQTGAGNALA